MNKETYILIRALSLHRVESRYKKPYTYKAVALKHAHAIMQREQDDRAAYCTLPGEILVMSTAEYAKKTKGMGEWKHNLLGNGKKIWIPFDTPACCDPSTETYHSM